MSDLLLEWVSFRRTGRFTDLPPEVVGDHQPRRAIEKLVTLGHAEIIGASTWQVAPPVLAGMASDDGGCIALLCGARTPGVLRRLAAGCSTTNAQLLIEELAGSPSLVRVAGQTKSELLAVAIEAGIRFQKDAASTLLACTPTIRNWPRTPCPMVAGRVETVRRFCRAKVGWVESTLDEATTAKEGFFRIKRDWDWVSIIKTSATQCAYMDDRAGRMAACAKLRIVSWDRATKTLSLPSQLYPPSLIARALTLCSGRLPSFDAMNHTISFSDVSHHMLRLTLELTGLKLL